MAELPEGLLPGEEDADLAAASALEDPFEVEEAEGEAPEPLGRSWAFDWEEGRFLRRGGAPAEVRGRDSLVQWLELARRTARGAHPAVFSEQFGMDSPEDWQGTVDVQEKIVDYGVRLEEAWLPHDRVAAVENYRAQWLPDDQTIYLESVDVITDEEESLSLGGPAPFFIGGE